MNDYELLRRYLNDGSQGDFAQLVGRHVNLVYSAANRLVRDPHLAEDVTQQTFVLLARKGGQLGSDTILSAWLYRAAIHLASETLRRDGRRHRREQLAVEAMNLSTPEAAWQQIEPMLDEAMADLSATEQDAVMLRYFENKSLKEVGEALGFSEDAAQKRVSRAVERLREFFAKRGVTVGTSGLVVVISANAVQAAPVGLAAMISSAATLAGTTLAATATATAAKTTAMTTLQKALITATIAAAVGTGIYQARQASNTRAQVETLQEQQAPLPEQVQQLQGERDDLASKLAGLHNDNERLGQDKSELLKPRGEVAALRNQTNELEKIIATQASALQERKSAPLVVTANDVLTNSIRVAPLPTMTDVYLRFRYEDKSPEVIMEEIIRRHIKKQVVISTGETNVAQGVLEGVLNINNIAVGLVLSFNTREEAEKARDCLRVRIKP